MYRNLSRWQMAVSLADRHNIIRIICRRAWEVLGFCCLYKILYPLGNRSSRPFACVSSKCHCNVYVLYNNIIISKTRIIVTPWGPVFPSTLICILLNGYGKHYCCYTIIIIITIYSKNDKTTLLLLLLLHVF